MRAHLAAGRLDQALEAQLGLAEHPLAAPLEQHSLLEQRDRVLQGRLPVSSFSTTALNSVSALSNGNAAMRWRSASSVVAGVAAVTTSESRHAFAPARPTSPRWRRTLMRVPAT